MTLPPPQSTPTDTLIPHTTLFRSLQLAALDAEAADERLVGLGQHLLGHLLDLHVHLRRLAGQLRHAPVGREGDVDGLLVALAMPASAFSISGYMPPVPITVTPRSAPSAGRRSSPTRDQVSTSP